MNWIALIIQLISGAIGGNIVGSSAKNLDLGTAGNSIAGIVGGGVGGQILSALVPALSGAAANGGLDMGAIIAQIASGGVGGGVLMAEVQQTSDATFRLYDWERRDAQGRSRTLHVEEALACIDWSAGPVDPVHAEGYPEGPGAAPSPHPARQRLVSCRYFTLDYVRQTEPFACGGRMQVLMVVHGRGSLDGPAGRFDLCTGDSLLLPAGAAPVECRPDGPLGVLLAALP